MEKNQSAINKSLNNALTKNKEKENINTETIENLNWNYTNKKQVDKKVREIRKLMEKSAKDLDFLQAAKYRDQIKDLKKIKTNNFS